jgi:hypothetical protein
MMKAVKWMRRVVGLPKSKKKPSQQPVRFNFERLGPPNLQLGLSSDQYEERKFTKRHEVIVAAVAALILQVGLISIATVTVFHDRTRRTLSVEPEIYGYPCYVVGTVFLCVGLGICAKAIERNTTEFDWQVLSEQERDPLRDDAGTQSTATGHKVSVDNCPRLFWLQKKQEVSDQAFDGYTILAGPKWHIITSSRREDIVWSSPEEQKGQSNDSKKFSMPTTSEKPFGVLRHGPRFIEVTNSTKQPVRFS